jgi:hypothetical protein
MERLISVVKKMEERQCRMESLLENLVKHVGIMSQAICAHPNIVPTSLTNHLLDVHTNFDDYEEDFPATSSSTFQNPKVVALLSTLKGTKQYGKYSFKLLQLQDVRFTFLSLFDLTDLTRKFSQRLLTVKCLASCFPISILFNIKCFISL